MKEYLGIEYEAGAAPELDPDFIPLGAWMRGYLSGADKPITLALEREQGKVSVRRSFIRGSGFPEANYRYVERLIKFLLWSVGGFRVYISGCEEQAERLKKAYSPDGERAFDAGFVRDVYGRELEIIPVSQEGLPAPNETAVELGGHLDGCRIGFDAGGSDRKVSAVIDGETVYSEEVVWFPKTNADPDYHYGEIVKAFRTAASKMPRVDAIGVSSAGVYVDNCPVVASLFIKVPREKRGEVAGIYKRAAEELGCASLSVANDGDVTALAGSMSLGEGSILGIAMGTSEAAGYVNADGKVLGWLNELAFAPVDLNEKAAADEWSSDKGVGCKYFSQDAVIRLAPRAGVELPEKASPAEKLKAAQKLADVGDPAALSIFRTMGAYLAHTISLYSDFYAIRHLLLLGRAASGAGGEVMLRECRRILADDYPALAASVSVALPDERMRRVGQSIAAASLPLI